MVWPTQNDYDEAAENLRYSMSDEELRGGQAALDDQQLPMVWAGSFANVYRINCPATGKSWALKCFTRDVSARQERYRHIAAALKAARLPFTVPFAYLERGIQVHGQWFPAVKMEWVEGQTLNRFVEESLEKPRMLRQLLDLWPKLAARLRDAGITHADLQHGNVLLVPAADGKLALKLIDYDGMYVPALAGTQSGEMGHPNYQHPWRVRQRAYNADVDRFSHLAIYSAVHCLLLGRRDLWRRFNNDENLLFREEDFRRPAESGLFRALWDMGDTNGRALVGRLLLSCSQPLEASPWLDRIVGHERAMALTPSEQQVVTSLVAARTAVPASVPPLPPVVAAGSEAPPGVVPAGEGGLAVVPDVALTGTAPIAAAGTVPLARRLRDRLGTAARGFDAVLRRLVGDENDVLRYFLWAALPLLLLVAAWVGIWALTPSPPPWKLQPITARTIEAGNQLKATATVENSDAWRGKVRYSLGPQRPAGATIDSQTGELAWTPPLDQAAGKYDFTVSAETPDGRHDETTLVVTVTTPIPLKLKPIEAQTVEAGKPLSVAVAMENAEVWKGKVRYSLGSPAPLGMGIDAATGIFTWTPTEDQAADKHKVTVLATGADGRRDETSFVVNVLRPIPPLKLKPIPAQTVEAGKPLQLAVTLENPDAWQGKVRYAIASLAFPGAKIDPQSGRFSWTPPQDQAAGQQEISVSATGREGQTTQASFTITVTRPIPVHPPATLADKEISVDLASGVKLEMVLVPPGEFLMGTPGNSGSEQQQHRVRITKPFYLGKYLVTQEQWETVMGSNPSMFKGPQNPVETVSWNQCQQFFIKLNVKSGPGRGKFQLPSEAQWEYACRAASTSQYCFGDDVTRLGEYAWYDNNSGSKTHPVGEKKPNAWGLYDMHGNVWEWCQDWYDGGYYAKSPMDDPAGPATGSNRVDRGGGWDAVAGRCRSAGRSYGGPGRRHCYLGFRASQVPADK